MTSPIRTALIILRKDLRQRLRDRSALLVAIVVPLVMASIFGLIFHNAIGGRVTFTFGIVDQDHGPAAIAFRRQVLGSMERDRLVTVVSEPSVAAARRAADTRKVAAAFVLPPGFSDAVGHGGSTTVTVIGSVDHPIGSSVAHSVAQAYADRLDTIRIATGAAGGAAINQEQVASARPPITVADVSAHSRQLDAGTFYAVGMAVFFVFFTVQFGISSILEERRDGTLARMLVAPVRSSTVLGGKLLTSIVLGTSSMVVLALATHFLLDAHWGNPIGVGILIVAGVLAATCVMALVATLARTPDQAQSWQSMVALVLGMLGGTFFPLAQAGGVLAALSLATPQAWFLQGIENLAGGAGPSAVAGPAVAIIVFAVATGSIAFIRAGRLVAR